MLVQVNVTYTASESRGFFASALLTITVIAPLAANPDTATVPSGGLVTINVLANDTGGTPPLRVPTISSLLTGQGEITITGASAISYKAPVEFTGEVS